eukprot:2619450-Amphidinium_carterae.1
MLAHRKRGWYCWKLAAFERAKHLLSSPEGSQNDFRASDFCAGKSESSRMKGTCLSPGSERKKSRCEE